MGVNSQSDEIIPEALRSWAGRLTTLELGTKRWAIVVRASAPTHWVLSAGRAEEVPAGSSELQGADCVITVEEDSLRDIIRGGVSPQELFSRGELRVSGNPELALLLTRVWRECA